MRKLISFMHVSLDGFISGLNGEMDWIKVDEEIFDYVNHITNLSDTAFYGRVTYEMMQSYWPNAANKPDATKHDIEHSRWYNKVNKVILSKTLAGKNIPGTQIISDNIKEEVEKLKGNEGSNILMFGSPGASQALTALNLIDEYWLYINPILLGKGMPLFKNIQNKITLKLVESIPFSNGVICLRYEKK